MLASSLKKKKNQHTIKKSILHPYISLYKKYYYLDLLWSPSNRIFDHENKQQKCVKKNNINNICKLLLSDCVKKRLKKVKKSPKIEKLKNPQNWKTETHTLIMNWKNFLVFLPSPHDFCFFFIFIKQPFFVKNSSKFSYNDNL